MKQHHIPYRAFVLRTALLRIAFHPVATVLQLKLSLQALKRQREVLTV